MRRLRQLVARWTASLIEDHPAGIPHFQVCGDFEETDCTLRGCYAVGHCRLYQEATEAVKTHPVSRSGRTDVAA